MTTNDLHNGWYLLALVEELTETITPVRIGHRRLMLLRLADEVVFADAVCPHRGADLSGGTLLRTKRGNDVVACPFHARSFRVGSLTRYPVMEKGGMIFGRLTDSDSGDRGLAALLGELLQGDVHSAVHTTVSAEPRLIPENAFDIHHFAPVHGVPLVMNARTRKDDAGACHIHATFRTGTDPFAQEARDDDPAELVAAVRGGADSQDSEFHAVAVSPSLVLTRYGSTPDDPLVVTGVLPLPEGGCAVRVAISANLPQEKLQHAVAGAERAFQQDIPVWEGLTPGCDHLDVLDGTVRAFRQFCAGFQTIPPVAGDTSCAGATSGEGK
ncbi:Rieske 2Fe-2S domain-containing protein [Propioniferax innocua]|uniref:Phenylpropionate dioxygenase-like ring-hydroxylating dioxygenase large terminal subunit n=1 Tax=Propioniferax innocua TaxID=1753 RepID=A0A542ZAQ1_9ACTN|nr:phenylpropionate dioxygenase-like ring-hydroxylating dioxygenase large terminal subunit [Propioniferax innocua]